MASSFMPTATATVRLRLRPQPRPGPGQIDAKVEIMNEKLTTVGTIMSSELQLHNSCSAVCNIVLWLCLQAQTNLLQM